MCGSMGVGSGGCAPLDFHVWYKYCRESLKSGIFGLFFVAPPPPRKRLNSAIFRYFLLIFYILFRCPSSGKFSADALVWKIWNSNPGLNKSYTALQTRATLTQVLPWRNNTERPASSLYASGLIGKYNESFGFTLKH